MALIDTQGPVESSTEIIGSEEWLERGAPTDVGVQLEPTDDLRELVASGLTDVELIAIHFPRFADGRGYSFARLLRDRHGYEGELRAVGDVIRDQLFFMHRVGFDTFDLREDETVENALKAFEEFSVTYQESSDGAAPIYRRGV